MNEEISVKITGNESSIKAAASNEASSKVQISNDLPTSPLVVLPSLGHVSLKSEFNINKADTNSASNQTTDNDCCLRIGNGEVLTLFALFF